MTLPRHDPTRPVGTSNPTRLEPQAIQAGAAAHARPVSSRWITGARYDALLYLLPCLTGYAAIWLHLGLQIPAILLWWAYVVALDGPHIFATLSRTVFDREERAQRAAMFWRSLLLFVPGPLAVLAGIASGTRAPFYAFVLFANTWAYWHVIRQHYGFLVLYQKKNGEPAGRDARLEWWAFYALMLLPFASFLLRHPQGREALLLAPALSAFEQQIVATLHFLVAVAAVAYAGHELRRWWSGRSLNLPKNLFLLTCVPLHLFVFLHPVVSTQSDALMFAVYVTVFHNVQYHGIVWFYNRNRYGNDPGGARYGIASRISRSFLTYYAAGLLFTILVRYSGWALIGTEGIPLGTGPNAISNASLGSFYTFSDFAFALWWGFALNHYWLDQKIWRTSRDRSLTRDLRLSS